MTKTLLYLECEQSTLLFEVNLSYIMYYVILTGSDPGLTLLICMYFVPAVETCKWFIILFQITNVMHNSFIFQQCICYTTILNMFRAARCSSSGGQSLSPQPLVSSPWKSVNVHILIKWRVLYCFNNTAHVILLIYDRSPISRVTIPQVWWCNLSSWGWAACCSKHVEDHSATYILLKNKGIVR